MNTPLKNREATEREALDRLLASGAFSRSPNLEKILVYLCTKHFEGQNGLIKEYHIATEALGRADSFDPKKDSIVRVEMHRLRRRLREYNAASADDGLFLVVPEKSYAVEFHGRNEQAAIAAPPDAGTPTERAIELEMPDEQMATVARPDSNWWTWPTITLCAAAAAFIWWQAPAVQQQQPSSLPARSEVAVTTKGLEPAPVDPAVAGAAAGRPTGEVIRILAGRPPGRFTDRFGQVWEGDRFFSGGASVPVTAEVASRGFDVNIFSNMRVGDFRYDIPLKPGVYELLLIFAETQYGERNPLGGGESSRVFSISANGKVVVPSFEAIADASESDTATARILRDIVPAADGKLHLEFGPASNGKPFLNAMVIRPGTPGRLRPIRIACRPEPYRDTRGNEWEPDHYYRAGKQISRPQGAPGPEGEVLRGERYGNFSYEIPVPPGKYGVRLFFWDYWWGEGHPGSGGVGSRVFSVFGNHKPLLIDFDIIRQSPGDQVAVRTFHGFEPNPQGKLVFDFVPKVNYAQLNAIEIFDEGGR